MDLSRGNSLSMFCASLLSVIGSLSTLTVLLFPDLRIKPVMRISIFINISNLLTACGSIVGEPLDKSNECYYQGIITNIFTLSSIFWCGIASYMLYTIVVLSDPYKINIYAHLVCWVLPTAVTFLPFINSTYGAPADLDYGWCFISSTETTPKWSLLFWVWFSFYGWVWMMLVIMMILFALTVQKIKDLVLQKNKLPLIIAYQKLEFYPFIIFICWFFPCLNDSFTYSPSVPNSEVHNNFASFAAVIPCLQGMLTAIFFWSTNPEVITRLLELRHHQIVSNIKIFTNKYSGTSSRCLTVTNDDDMPVPVEEASEIKRKFKKLSIIESETNYVQQRRLSINSFSLLSFYLNELDKIEVNSSKKLENIEENNNETS